MKILPWPMAAALALPALEAVHAAEAARNGK